MTDCRRARAPDIVRRLDSVNVRGMPRIHLSPAFVKSAACPDGLKKVEYFDYAQRGFMLEVRCSGGKTYYQRYSDARGRERQFKIGPADMLSLSAARRKGKATVAEVLMGTDPQDRRAELRTIPTLAELVRDRYLPHVKSYKRSWTTDETVLRVHVLPVLGATFVDVLRAEPIARIVQSMRDRGYASGTTNRVVIVLRHLFNLARKWRVPGVTENPTAGITLAPDVTRERFLSFEEAKRLIASIQQDENRVAARAIMLLLLTGARRNEITRAKWEYVDWEKRKLLVPLSKSGKPRTIALNSAALELLQRLRAESQGCYIVPSSVTGEPPPSLFFPWKRIRERAGLSDLRLHDLRHSFASFLVNRGISLYVVQELLGHGHTRYTQRYAHLMPETLHEAAETVGEVVASATQGITWPGNSVPAATP
jgi:integrase